MNVNRISFLSRFTLALGLAAATPLIFAATAPAATIFSDDFSAGNLSPIWTYTSVTNSTYTETGGQLQIVDKMTTSPGGSSITSVSSLNIGGAPVLASFQITSTANNGTAAQLTSLLLNNKIGLVYWYTGASATSANKEAVRLYVDTNNDGLDINNGSSGGSDMIWDSTSWNKGSLFTVGNYLGFRVSSSGWEVVKSSDGVTYSTLVTGNNTSVGTFGTPFNMNFNTPVVIGTPNGKAKAAGATITLDNVSVSLVPEPASLSLLALGGLLMLRRRSAH